MKYLAILIAFLFVAINANASYNGETSAEAEFDCMVIAPLTWVTPSNVTLPVVIAGTTRPVAGTVLFKLSGENTHAVNIRTYGPEDIDGVTLNGDWNGEGAQTLGTVPLEVKYDYTGITAAAGKHGPRVFKLKVDAQYTDL